MNAFPRQFSESIEKFAAALPTGGGREMAPEQLARMKSRFNASAPQQTTQQVMAPAANPRAARLLPADPEVARHVSNPIRQSVEDVRGKRGLPGIVASRIPPAPAPRLLAATSPGTPAAMAQAHQTGAVAPRPVTAHSTPSPVSVHAPVPTPTATSAHVAVPHPTTAVHPVPHAGAGGIAGALAKGGRGWLKPLAFGAGGLLAGHMLTSHNQAQQ